ncbi:MAG: hypothetical protein WBG49_07275 [Thermoanaerobaculia bacterium]
MTGREVLILVFAPAVVGFLVAALRLTPRRVYWAGLLGMVALMLLVLWMAQLEAEKVVNGPLALGIVFLVVPTLAAAAVGRLEMLSSRGAFVFAGACSAYLLMTAVAAGLGATLGLLVP